MDQKALMIYLRFTLSENRSDPYEMVSQLREMGYDMGGDPEPFEMPSLMKYVGRIAKEFDSYLSENLPKLGPHMDEERVAGILDLVDEHIFEDDGPNFKAILGLAEELDLKEDQLKEWLSSFKVLIITLMQ
jgi:hypothetical protein